MLEILPWGILASDVAGRRGNPLLAAPRDKSILRLRFPIDLNQPGFFAAFLP